MIFRLPVQPWRRRLTLILAGALGALALAPVGFIPALIFPFAALCLALDQPEPEQAPPARGRIFKALWRQGFGDGWAVGFGWFTGGLFWIGNSLLIEPGLHGWIWPFAALGIPAFLALFWAAAAAICQRLWHRGAGRLLLLAAMIGLVEWVRGHILTGFPWNMPGQAFAANAALMQPAALVGAYGLNLAAVYLGAAPALLVQGGSGLAITRRLAAALLLLGLMSAYGTYRLADPVAPAPNAAVVRIVQPNIAQTLKWLPEQRAQTVATLLELTALPAAAPPALILWPEAATPFLLQQAGGLRERIGGLLAPGAFLLTGSPRAEQAEGEEEPRYFNSVLVVDQTGAIIATYDKFHLVPFGEYVPLEPILSAIGLTRIANAPGSFDVGPGPQSLSLPGLPVLSPLICYEVIFPNAVRDPGNRPQMLVNVTNDAWWGRSPGPYQHLDQARLRAVEEGLPLIRAANSGISAVIDARGQVLAEQPLETQGVVDHPLPSALPETPYARWGDLIAGILAFMALAIGLRGGRVAP